VVPKYKDREPADILLEFVDAGKNKNILSQEFALREQTDLDDFMANHFGNFKLIMLAERFDESLVLLRRLFNWGVFACIYSGWWFRHRDLDPLAVMINPSSPGPTHLIPTPSRRPARHHVHAAARQQHRGGQQAMGWKKRHSNAQDRLPRPRPCGPHRRPRAVGY